MYKDFVQLRFKANEMNFVTKTYPKTKQKIKLPIVFEISIHFYNRSKFCANLFRSKVNIENASKLLSTIYILI